MQLKKFEVGNRVKLTHILNGVWTKVGDEGVIAAINGESYTVKFASSGVIGGLNDNDLKIQSDAIVLANKSC